MIRLTDILLENSKNRVNLMKLEAIMEKMKPEFTKAENKKISELCTEVHQMAESLNNLPYTIFNHQEWNLLRLGLMAKLVEVKAEAEKLMGEGKVDVVHFIKALDELIVS